MADAILPILQNPAVLQRTSRATRLVLEERGQTSASTPRFLPSRLFALLQQITAAIVPQDEVGTVVDIAGSIDRRLLEGKNAGWRFAGLPPDAEAYTRALTVFSDMLKQTQWKSFDRMLPSAREGYLRCVANGDVDAIAAFPLSKWLGMLRTDAVQIWMAHPSTMQKMEYYGFADGETGQTNGPTDKEGWAALTPNTALPFEQGIVLAEQEQKA